MIILLINDIKFFISKFFKILKNNFFLLVIDFEKVLQSNQFEELNILLNFLQLYQLVQVFEFLKVLFSMSEFLNSMFSANAISSIIDSISLLKYPSLSNVPII